MGVVIGCPYETRRSEEAEVMVALTLVLSTAVGIEVRAYKRESWLR